MRCGPLGLFVEREMAEASEIARQGGVVGWSARRVQQLELDRGTQDEVVRLEQRLPALGREPAPVPRARVSEVLQSYVRRSRRSSSGSGPMPPEGLRRILSITRLR